MKPQVVAAAAAVRDVTRSWSREVGSAATTDPTTRCLNRPGRGGSTVTSHRTVLALVAAAGLVVASCSAGGRQATTAATPTSSEELAVTVASFDLSAGDDQRFLAGVLTPDRQVIGGGNVDMAFAYLGDDASTDSDAEPATTATGSFLPVPGTPTPTDLEEPVVLGEPAGGHHLEDSGDSGNGDGHDHEDLSAAGVYEATADFDRAGFWEVTVTADVDGWVRTGTAVFEVQDDAQVPEVGDAAPRTSTLTLDSAAPAEAIDSRAGPRSPVPDEILHRVDLVDALDAGRPVVVVFSTPTYCTSRFCGPITEAVEDIAEDHSDRAAFVHVEIWHDIDERRFNDAVEDWLVTDDGGNEPWVFLIDADGTIAARWDNVLDADDLTARLEALPPT